MADTLTRLDVSPSALYALVIAVVVTAALTPVMMRVAWRLGVVDKPGGRRIHDRPIPLLGGVAILLGIVAAVLPNLDVDERYRLILIGAGAAFIGFRRWIAVDVPHSLGVPGSGRIRIGDSLERHIPAAVAAVDRASGSGAPVGIDPAAAGGD